MKMAAENSTFNQLLEIYQQSRSKGLEASLTLETRDGKDFINFTIGNQAGFTACKGRIKLWTSFEEKEDTISVEKGSTKEGRFH